MKTVRKPKVAVIGTVGLPAKYGGFETLAEHLIDNLHDDFQLTVYCTGKKYDVAQRPREYKGARLVYLPFDANGLQSIPYDCLSMLHALFYADVLLILGVSGGVMLPFVRWFTRKKIIISIDGIEWKRAKWPKIAKWYLWASEWLSVKFSHADIADNESIQDYTAIRYKSLSTLIEYGADHVVPALPTKADRKEFPFLDKPYACTVCRIEPENNVHVVLSAFRQLPNQTLVMVGNWNQSAYGRKLREEHADCPNIHLLDPIYEQGKLDVIRSNCRVYIHGHSAGGTNPSLVDAMFLALPIFAFDVAYNRTTTEGQARYFKTHADLTALLVATNSRDYEAQSQAMQRIAQRRYVWPVIAHKYGALIQLVLFRPQKMKLVPTMTRRLSPKVLVREELGHMQFPTLFYEK